jgi:hypothetical protein
MMLKKPPSLKEHWMKRASLQHLEADPHQKKYWTVAYAMGLQWNDFHKIFHVPLAEFFSQCA